MEEIDLSRLLGLSVQTMEAAAEKKGLRVVSDLENNIKVKGDAERIMQAVINLVSNAIKFTKQGQVKVSLERIEDKAQIVVEDTGVGIRKKDQKKLFTKFWRADDEYIRNAGGTGLGLSIVKTIIEKHHGTISVESKPNKGTKFTVWLPIQS